MTRTAAAELFVCIFGAIWVMASIEWYVGKCRGWFARPRPRPTPTRQPGLGHYAVPVVDEPPPRPPRRPSARRPHTLLDLYLRSTLTMDVIRWDPAEQRWRS